VFGPTVAKFTPPAFPEANMRPRCFSDCGRSIVVDSSSAAKYACVVAPAVLNDATLAQAVIAASQVNFRAHASNNLLYFRQTFSKRCSHRRYDVGAGFDPRFS